MCELQYADDNAILANTKEDLQNTMDAFNAAYTQLGLKLNIKKTQVLHQTRLGDSDPQPVIITVDGQALDNVESYTYLGSCLSSGATIDAEIERRIQAANTALARLRERVFRNKEIYARTKMKVYKAIVLPTLLFGSKTWVTYSRHLKSLEMFHMRSLRRILGVTWQHKRTNNSILDEAKTTSIEAMIIKNQLRWAGHVTAVYLSGSFTLS